MMGALNFGIPISSSLNQNPDMLRRIFTFLLVLLFLWMGKASAFVPSMAIDQGINQEGKVGKPKVHYVHTDHLGTPQEMTDADGKIEWSAEYTAWGQRQYALPLNADEESEIRVDCALRFQGQYFDAETGLHYNTFRYYDPGCGRFISPDPINILGGLNLYQYAPNAINWIDPWGWACHHIATNKHAVWSPMFRNLFNKYGLGRFKNGKTRKDVLNDPLNKIEVPGHKGPHPEEMHQAIYDRLESAGQQGGKAAVEAELRALQQEAATVGSDLNKILTKMP
jgi:RHS repeat-associated protein